MPVSVYQIQNKINDKSYIGISINIKKRWKEHIKGHYQSTIHCAIKKYGKENFDFNILDEVDGWEEACEKEIYWIKKLDTFKNGYNNTKGGDGVAGLKSWNKGGVLPQKQKDKISNTLKGRFIGELNPFYGKKHSKKDRKKMSKACKAAMTEERKKEISEFHKGRKQSEETKAKKRGKIPWNKGVPCREETKKKMSDTRRGKNTGEDTSFYGKYHTKENKEIIGNTHRGNKYNLGRKFSDEHKAKLAKAKLKLSLEQALKVKEYLKKGMAQSKIAKLFKVSNTVIKNIKIGKTYYDI